MPRPTSALLRSRPPRSAGGERGTTGCLGGPYHTYYGELSLGGGNLHQNEGNKTHFFKNILFLFFLVILSGSKNFSSIHGSDDGNREPDRKVEDNAFRSMVV